MDKVCRIIVVRHGQTQWNLVERFRGRSDIPLDEVGLQQAAAVASRLRSDRTLAAVYSSPLRRAWQTAEPIAEAQGLEVEAVPSLLDQNFGEWEGLTIPEVSERYPAMFQTWQQKPHLLRIPGGESLDDVRERVMTSLRQVISKHPGQIIALVTHRVVSKVLLCAVLGLDNSHFWRLEQGNTAVNEFDAMDPGRGFYLVRSLNDTCHLRDLR